MKVGDIVYTQSSERYGKAHITECVIEEIAGDTLLLYAVYDNRTFYREAKEVLTYDELMEDITVIKDDQLKRVLKEARENAKKNSTPLGTMVHNGTMYNIVSNKNGKECIMLSNNYQCWIKAHGGTCPLNCNETHLEPI